MRYHPHSSVMKEVNNSVDLTLGTYTKTSWNALFFLNKEVTPLRFLDVFLFFLVLFAQHSLSQRIRGKEPLCGCHRYEQKMIIIHNIAYIYPNVLWTVENVSKLQRRDSISVNPVGSLVCNRPADMFVTAASCLRRFVQQTASHESYKYRLSRIYETAMSFSNGIPEVHFPSFLMVCM